MMGGIVRISFVEIIAGEAKESPQHLISLEQFTEIVWHRMLWESLQP